MTDAIEGEVREKKLLEKRPITRKKRPLILDLLFSIPQIRGARAAEQQRRYDPM